jgi:hypothetical protein
LAKKSTSGKKTPSKSTGKNKTAEVPKKLLIEIEIESRRIAPWYKASWKVTRVLDKRRK